VGVLEAQEFSMTRFVLVPVIAVAITGCAPRPPIALRGNERPAVAVNEEAQHLHEVIRQIVQADYAG
jgi:hypothetical protein